MHQDEEELSKSLRFYWKLCTNPPTYDTPCAPRNQHCLNLWYLHKGSCQAKGTLRHITFVQRRIPAGVKCRERDLFYQQAHRDVKWVPIKNRHSAHFLQQKGHRERRRQQAIQKILSLYSQGNGEVQMKASFFYFVRRVGRSRLLGLHCVQKEDFPFFWNPDSSSLLSHSSFLGNRVPLSYYGSHRWIQQKNIHTATKESKTALLVQPYRETARQKHEKIDCLAKNEIAGKSSFNPAISSLAAAPATQAVLR